MHDMVTIDTIVFEVVGERGVSKPPTPPPRHPRIVNFLIYPGSSRAKIMCHLKKGNAHS